MFAGRAWGAVSLTSSSPGHGATRPHRQASPRTPPTTVHGVSTSGVASHLQVSPCGRRCRCRSIRPGRSAPPAALALPSRLVGETLANHRYRWLVPPGRLCTMHRAPPPDRVTAARNAVGHVVERRSCAYTRSNSSGQSNRSVTTAGWRRSSPARAVSIPVDSVMSLSSRATTGRTSPPSQRRSGMPITGPGLASDSRGPQTLKDLVAELGPRARAATPAEAAAPGDLVVVSIPPRAYPAVPVQPLAGKPVLDAINYIPERDGRIPGLGGSLSSSEVLQRHLGTAHVVKVFNNIFFKHLASLARPAGAAAAVGAADRSALPIARDDPAAKAAVARFLDAIGYDTVDAGPLGSGGPRFQFGTRAFVAPYGTLSDPRGTPAGAAAIRAALGAG